MWVVSCDSQNRYWCYAAGMKPVQNRSCFFKFLFLVSDVIAMLFAKSCCWVRKMREEILQSLRNIIFCKNISEQKFQLKLKGCF